MNRNIICVVGPTASGKTRLAVELARAYNGEVLSCDSMQIYRGMDIGTAKPTAEETDGIPHHMIDVVDPAEPFSVGRYVEMADPVVQDILSRGKTCVICGGTGLYVDSLMAGRTFAPFPETGRRQELEALADAQGIEAVMAILEEVDPERAQKLHLSDRRRIIRAVEVWQETGKSLTQHDLETQAVAPKYDPVWIGLDFENRADLYARIDLRVDLMMKDGLVEEIQGLLDRGTPPTATSLQAIGYKEPMAALRGEMTMEEAVEKIKQESRRYAKRQLTWFRRNKKIHWIIQKAPLNFADTWNEAVKHMQ
jgi:tRNA dimethylallyltransferase